MAAAIDWTQARAIAFGILRRFTDAWTQTHVEDIAQDACLELWRWTQKGEEIRDLAPAVATLTRRRRLHLQGRTRYRIHAPLEAAGSVEPMAPPEPENPHSEHLRAALIALPPDDHAMLIARDLHREPLDTIAEREGITRSAAQSRVFRARLFVRESIAPAVVEEIQRNYRPDERCARRREKRRKAQQERREATRTRARAWADGWSHDDYERANGPHASRATFGRTCEERDRAT